MSKAERYIELVSDENGYLCDQHALRAVEIAKEEVIEKFICWLKDNFRDDAGLCCIISDFDTTKEMYNDLKQAMKDE
jgi:hypothetical protein